MNRKKLFKLLLIIAVVFAVLAWPAFAEEAAGEEHRALYTAQSGHLHRLLLPLFLPLSPRRYIVLFS